MEIGSRNRDFQETEGLRSRDSTVVQCNHLVPLIKTAVAWNYQPRVKYDYISLSFELLNHGFY